MGPAAYQKRPAGEGLLAASHAQAGSVVVDRRGVLRAKQILAREAHRREKERRGGEALNTIMMKREGGLWVDRCCVRGWAAPVAWRRPHSCDRPERTTAVTVGEERNQDSL